MATSPLETDQALVLYTHPMSRGRIVRWMLEETGQPYRAEVLGYGQSMKSAGYLAINPMGKVPALVHRGVVVTETAAICAYLADAFASAGLAPALDDAQRGAYLRLLFLAAGPLERRPWLRPNRGCSARLSVQPMCIWAARSCSV